MRWRSVLLTACSALALAGCGGDEQKVERRTDTTPRIDGSVAGRLAVTSDNIARLLESGNSCAAAQEAARLRTDLNASIGAIPDLYVEDLSGLVNEIQAQIPPCETEGSDDDGKKKQKKDKNEKKKQHKHKHKHKHGDADEGDD